MEKREKIILVIVLIGLAYVAYTYLGAGAKVLSVSELVNMPALDKVKKDVDEMINKDPLSEMEQYRLKVAETAWVKNPFYDRIMDLPKEEAKKPKLGLPDGVTIVYSGFLSINGKIYAIISVKGQKDKSTSSDNGMEYVEGDEIELAGYFVKKITSKKVIIGQKDETGNITDQHESVLEELSY